MKMAEEEASKRGTAFFFPCLYKGVSYDQLPKISEMFKAADIGSNDGFFIFTSRVRDILKRTV